MARVFFVCSAIHSKKLIDEFENVKKCREAFENREIEIIDEFENVK